MTHAIHARGLRQAYGDHVVLDGGEVRVAGHDPETEPAARSASPASSRPSTSC
jgi:hypothetical protein